MAPGCLDLIDFASWQDIPERYQDCPFREHNRLIKSSAINSEERRETVQAIAERLSKSPVPIRFIMPLQGIEEWDKRGNIAHDPEGLATFTDEVRKVMTNPISLSEIDAHINDQAFADKALEIFDAWVADGTVKT